MYKDGLKRGCTFVVLFFEALVSNFTLFDKKSGIGNFNIFLYIYLILQRKGQ